MLQACDRKIPLHISFSQILKCRSQTSPFILAKYEKCFLRPRFPALWPRAYGRAAQQWFVILATKPYLTESAFAKTPWTREMTKPFSRDDRWIRASRASSEDVLCQEGNAVGQNATYTYATVSPN